MIYKMSKVLFVELGGRVTKNGYLFNKPKVIGVINESFGLRGIVKDITLV